MRSYALVFAVLLLFGVTSVNAVLSSPVPGCMDISAPGQYVLTANLVGANVSGAPFTNLACVRISVSNVTLDCAGFTINNNDSSVPNTVGVLVEDPTAQPISNLVVKNCPGVSNYTYGMYIANATNALVTNSVATNDTNGFVFTVSSSNSRITSSNATNDFAGFVVAAGPGITLSGDQASGNNNGFVLSFAEGDNLTGNNATGNVNGFLLNPTFNNTLTNNLAASNSGSGFSLQSSTSDTLTANKAFGNNEGISIQSSTGGRFIGNNASNNVADGFLLSSAFFSLFNLNTADQNGNDGFDISASTQNNFTSNEASFNNQTGFYAGVVSSGNIFRLNNAHDNQQNGFYVDTSAVLLDRNNAFQNLQDGFLLDTATATNVTGGSAYSNSRDGYELVNSAGIIVSNMTAHDNSNDGLRMWQGGGQNRVQDSTANNNGNNGFEVACCGSSDNNAFLHDTAFANGNNGFLISEANGNLIDNSLSYGQESGDGYQVFGCARCSFNNITNSVAHDNNVGYEISGEDNDYLFNNVAHHNHFAGFELDQFSTLNTLVQNLAYNNTNPVEGCFFFGGPESAGFVIDSSSGNSLINDTSHDNSFICNSIPLAPVKGPAALFVSTFPLGHGFSITSSNGQSDNNMLQGDTAYSNGVAGFAENNQQAGTDNNYTDSLSHDNQFGFSLIGDDSDFLTNVTAHHNSVAGFFEQGVFSGSNNAFINSSSFQNNGWDIMQNSTNDLPFTIVGTMLGNVNISLSDFPCCSGGYSINESGSMGHPQTSGDLSSFRGKFLKVLFQGSDESIDQLDFHWAQFETQNFNMSSLVLLTWNGTDWVQNASQSLDLGNNTLTSTNLVNITSDDLYGLFARANVSSTPGGNPGTGPSLSAGLQSNCSGNTITVSSGGPVGAADVIVDGNSVGTTDQNGQVSFQGCGNTVTIRASKSGYQDAVSSQAEVACGQCVQPKCTTDADCASDQKCQVNADPSLNKCVLVSCPCGQTASDHQCQGQAWQCGSGANCASCPQGQVCGDDHMCKPAGCTSDLQCKDGEVCRTSSGAPGTGATPGSCKSLCADGTNSCQCSVAQNHTLVPLGYECGSEPGCSSCPSGQSCIEHKCVQNDINCPSSVVVGDNANCKVTQNNQACGPNDNCTTTVTTPDGKTLTIPPDSNGNVVVPGSVTGRLKIDLLKDGQVVKEVFVDVLPKSGQPENPPPTAQGGGDLFSLMWLLLLLLLVIAAVIYWRSRGQRK